MKLFNSLTQSEQTLKPIRPGTVSLYTCGPTVYDHLHIGNLRTYVFEDTLRRVLKLAGYRLKHVMNITDVEDKIIARSRQRYPTLEPLQAMHKLTSQYERLFLKDAARIGIDLDQTKLVRATEHIKDMQSLIAKIPHKYLADDGVYFDITKYKDYGVFVRLDRSHSHHRINNDEYDKDHVADFALWKKQKGKEPSWEFNIEGQDMRGRPGWHIECSAMAAKYLGQPFDIHTGGVDLKFPHHENELAQSRSANRKTLAKVWLHAEHLLIDGQRMGKSLKNFYVVDDLVGKGFDPLAFRLLVLQSHYRSQLNFTWKSLAAAQSYLQSLRALADRQFQVTQSGAGLKAVLTTAESTITEAIKDDLDTPKALAALRSISDWLDERSLRKQDLPHFKKFLGLLDEVFGLGLAKRKDIEGKQKALITKREQARQDGDFAAADSIRQDLAREGIGLNDNVFGVTWQRLN